MNAIEVTKLSKTYPGGVEAVKGIDFEVAAGEVFGLLGPNGGFLKSSLTGRASVSRQALRR
jgi:ABC-2 type transport system ATP-binding protein